MGVRNCSLVLVALVIVAPIASGAADQVVANCANDTELRADLTAMQSGDGGTLTFSCAPATIVLTADLPTIVKPTTIDGGEKITISGGNARRIFVVDGAAALSLEDIVLSNGSTSGDGGAIFSSGSLSMSNVTIRDSVAALSGGAFVAYGPTLVEDSELDSNTASSGGAVYARFGNAPVTIRRTWIHDNEATSPTTAWGGGVLLWDGASVLIEDSLLSDNFAEDEGGAIHNAFSNSAVTVVRSRILGGNCRGQGGAGIFISGGPLTLTDCVIAGNNNPGSGAGLYYSNGASATVTGTTFHDNGSGSSGGAVRIFNSTGVSFVNVTMSGNHAETTSALSIRNSSVSLLNVTVASNGAFDSVGAISQNSDDGRVVTLKNVLMADNEDPNCGVYEGTMVSQGGNVSDDGSGFGILVNPNDHTFAQALLNPLALHGGTTPTHVPQPGSEAIDAGVSTGVTEEDQRGFARLQGASVDAGAVEVASCSPGEALCGDANEDDAVSSSDALKALRTAVGSATCSLWLCDHDGNGNVTVADALGILRVSVGQLVTPSCPPKWDCHPG